jgi:DNA replication protein DnaC
MEARIERLQALSKTKNLKQSDFDKIREDSLKDEREKRLAESVNHLITKLPLRFQHRTFQDYIAETKEKIRIKTIAERYVLSFKERLETGSNLFFIGKSGTGKTLLSLIIYQEIAKAGHFVQYEPTIDFIKRFLDIRFKSEASFQNEIRHYYTSHLLILDEVTESLNRLGVPSPCEKQFLFRLINERYQRKLCTIMISNRDYKEIDDLLGTPTIDRVSENGIFLAFNWDSFRRNNP